MSSTAKWPATLGPPDLTVMPDWRPGQPGSPTVNYWMCGDVPHGFREIVKAINLRINSNDAAAVDESTFNSLAVGLSELDLKGQICSAVYDARDAAWHGLKRCALHAETDAGPYFLIVELASATGPRPEVLTYESVLLAEQALSSVGTSIGDTVTFTNERGALLRVRRELIVDARISAHAPPQSN